MTTDFVAGLIGGTLGISVAFPFDTVKTIQQNFNIPVKQIIFKIVKQDGLRGFYKGFLTPLLIVGPSNALFFGVYGNLIRRWEHEESHVSMRDSHNVFWAGCTAGFFQVFITTPIELVKTIIQTQSDYFTLIKDPEAKYAGSIATFKNILEQYGLRGLYRGIVPTMFRDIPTSGIYTLTYETLRFSTFQNWNTSNMAKELLAGGVAGILSTNIVLPIDVVKSRIQADDPISPEYNGFIHCFRKIYHEEGYQALLKGFNMTFVRVFVMHAITFSIYQKVDSYMRLL